MYYTIKEITALHLDILQEFPGFAGRPEKIILNGSKGFRGFTGKNPVERCQNRAVWITKESLFSDIVVMSITTFPNTNLLNAFSRNEIGNVVYPYGQKKCKKTPPGHMFPPGKKPWHFPEML